MALGINLKNLREARGWDQPKLSKLSGVSVGTISALEVRKSRRSDKASALAAALGVTVEELVSDDPYAPHPPAPEVVGEGAPTLGRALEVLARHIHLAGPDKQDNLINLMALLVRNPGNKLYAAAIEAELQLLPRFETNHAAGLPPTTAHTPHEPV